MKDTKLFELVTGTQIKPWLTRNMLPNINTCKNGWSNFSANLRVGSVKLLELTQFALPNLSIYFNFLCAVPRDDVIESTRFLMRPPVNHSTVTVCEFFIWLDMTTPPWCREKVMVYSDAKKTYFFKIDMFIKKNIL